MKAKSNIDKCSRVVAAFLFIGATAVGIWSTMTFDQSKEKNSPKRWHTTSKSAALQALLSAALT